MEETQDSIERRLECLGVSEKSIEKSPVELEDALDAMEEMRIHCPETAFDELVRTLSALDENEPGSVEKAAELAAEYDRCIGDLSAFQRAMVRVAASPSGQCSETRRLAARAGFRSIARAVLRIRDKKKRETRKVKLGKLGPKPKPNQPRNINGR